RGPACPRRSPCPTLFRSGHDLRFRLRAVSPGVQHVVLDTRALQHPAERLGNLNGRRTHEHRLSVLVVLLDFLDRRTVLLALRLVDRKSTRLNSSHVKISY